MFTFHDAARKAVRQDRHLDRQSPAARGLVAVNIEPVAGHSTVATELFTIRGNVVTRETVIDITSLPTGVNVDAVLDAPRLRLSVARGTRVQWLYRRDRDASGNEVTVTHASHITRQYQGFKALDHRGQAREHTKRFLEGASAALLARATNRLI